MSEPADDVSMEESEAMTENDPKAHEPFTVAENIHQLNAIDSSIVQLMHHTATALNALTMPTPPNGSDRPSEAPKPPLDPPSQKQAFRSAADSFLTTLQSIDVRMKRQVLALEEAGIVDLSTRRQDPLAPKGGVQASLKPNGVGAIGNLDVGWLNSRGSRVERDMELELWKKARDFLEQQGDKLKIG